MTAEKRWVTVPEFAAYLGVSTPHAYRLVAHDPDIAAVSRRFGRRVLVCLWAWKQGQEASMLAPASASFPRTVPLNARAHLSR